MPIVRWAAILLAGCLRTGSQAPAQMTPATFDSLFERASHSRGADYVRARDEILNLPSRDQVRARLQTVMKAPSSWREHLAASILLGWMDNNEAFKQVAVYLRQPLAGTLPVTGLSPAVRGKAIASLGRIITPRVLEMLWNAPDYQNDHELGSLLSALLYLKDERAVQPLVALIEDSESPPLRRGVIKVLSEVGGPRGLAVVSRLAEESNDASVRLAAIAGLGGFASNRATVQLLNCLQAQDRTVDERRAAAMALYKQGTAVPHDGVTRALRDERVREVRLPLILLLGEIGHADDIGLLEGLVREDAALERSTADAIQQIRRRAQQ